MWWINWSAREQFVWLAAALILGEVLIIVYTASSVDTKHIFRAAKWSVSGVARQACHCHSSHSQNRRPQKTHRADGKNNQVWREKRHCSEIDLFELRENLLSAAASICLLPNGWKSFTSRFANNWVENYSAMHTFCLYRFLGIWRMRLVSNFYRPPESGTAVKIFFSLSSWVMFSTRASSLQFLQDSKPLN